MKNSIKIKKLVGIAILTALVVVLQFIGNTVTIGNLSINLSLIPIAVGAILYGPLAGLFLGICDGAIVLFTAQAFLAYSPVITVFMCLLKTGLAGLFAGLVYKGIYQFVKLCNDDKSKRIVVIVSAFVSTLIIPIINTLIYITGASLFFEEVYAQWGFDLTSGSFKVIFFSTVGINFAIEFAINVILSPALLTLIKVLTRNHDLGFANDFSLLQENYEDIETPTSSDGETKKSN